MDEPLTSHDWDVVIVSAVGGHTANLLSKRGQRVLLLEEHNEIGRPFQCAGLVTPNAMKQVNLYDTILEEVDGALIHGPSGTLVPVGTGGTVRTYVVCRKLFDEAVVKQSMVSGATLWLNSKPIHAETQEDRVNLSLIRDGEEIQISTKLLIGCDGAHSWTGDTSRWVPKRVDDWFSNRSRGYQIEKMVKCIPVQKSPRFFR